MKPPKIIRSKWMERGIQRLCLLTGHSVDLGSEKDRDSFAFRFATPGFLLAHSMA